MILKNEKLTVQIAAFGAELKSIKDKNGTEYLWQANPEFWAKTSPVLFPIVGSLINNTYKFIEKEYTLSRHGFARDKEFVAHQINDQKAEFVLEATTETLAVFPFRFGLKLVYELRGNELICSYFVTNKDDETLYFSLGAHPAFSFNAQDLNTYILAFNNDENLHAIQLKNGLLSNKTKSINLQNNELPLSYELFSKDALVFRNLKSDEIVLKNTLNEQALKFKFKNFSHFGIWSAPNANFVCLEPWCGVADSVNHNQDFTTKEGIVTLVANQTFQVSWSVEIV